MTTPKDPSVIVVILPARPELAPDREAEQGFARGLCDALRESYPESILDVQWNLEAKVVQVECYSGAVADEVIRITRRFSMLWLLAMQAVRDYICRRMSLHSKLLPLGSHIQAPCRGAQ